MYKYSSHHLQTRDVSFICMKMNAYNIFKSIKQVHPQSLSWLQACVLKLLKNFFTSPGGGGICFVFQKFLGCNELLYAWGASCCHLWNLVSEKFQRKLYTCQSRDVAVSSTALVTKSEQHFLTHLFTHETTAVVKDASESWFLALLKGTHHPFWYTITRMWGSLHLCPLGPPQFWEHHGCFSLPLLAAGLTGRDD